MITSRQRVLRCLKRQPIDRPPRDLWVTQAVEANRGDEVAELRFRYPSDVVRPDFRYPRGHRARGAPGDLGEHVDAWGCAWRVPARGAAPELCGAPLAAPAQVGGYSPPWEILEKMNRGAIDRSCAATAKFVLAWTDVRPCERLAALCGPWATADLDAGGKPSRDVLDLLHDFYVREIEAWAATDVDGVAFGDSWGVSANAWRGLLKPLYREFCETLRGRDKFVFFHSPSDPGEVFDDLVEIGVDALHCPPPPDGQPALERFRNRVTYWSGLDDPRTLGRAHVDEVRASVNRARTAFDHGRGGVVVQCEWAPSLPFEAVAAVFEQWLAPACGQASRMAAGNSLR